MNDKRVENKINKNLIIKRRRQRIVTNKSTGQSQHLPRLHTYGRKNNRTNRCRHDLKLIHDGFLTPTYGIFNWSVIFITEIHILKIRKLSERGRNDALNLRISVMIKASKYIKRLVFHVRARVISIYTVWWAVMYNLLKKAVNVVHKEPWTYSYAS